MIGASGGASTYSLRRATLLRVLTVASALVLTVCDAESRNNRGSETSTTAAASTSTAPTTTAPPISYQVQRGDTLTAIATQFGVSSAAIVEANQLANPDQLTEGQILSIPPAPPARLAVTPAEAPAGETFMLHLTGAQAGEVITFEIEDPDGDKFTGPPHTASPEGSETASYGSSGDDPGTYKVVATGDRGTSLRTRFRVLRG